MPAVATAALPSFCWTYSLTAALFFIWGCAQKRQAALLGSIAFGIGVLYEALQAAGILPGTFDWGDVIASGMASLLTAFVFQKNHP